MTNPLEPWPAWPEVSPRAEAYLLDAMRSGRWALSSRNNGNRLYERRFAAAFAAYTGAGFCVPTDHGSSALLIALEALGAEYGSEVVVPALTWVATASAVLRAGLVPVLADVDPCSGCVTPGTIAEAMSEKTVAVIVVHWACVMADVPAILEFARTRGIEVIEDAAQAHGATWNGKAAGTFGIFGCFSMQHAKVLACGEGGAVITNREASVQALQELRADSRSYRDDVRPDQLELQESASIMGANLGLSELNAALLLAQLEVLPEQHAVRNSNYRLLEASLAECSAARLLRRAPEQDGLSVYEVPVVFAGLRKTTAELAAELTKELGMQFYLPRAPLGRSALLQPDTKPSLRALASGFANANKRRVFRGAEHLASNAIVFHHAALLASEANVQAIGSVVRRVAMAATRT